MPKYLMITTRSIFIPGDERSRTNPGHGYPETTEHVVENHFFDTEEALLSYIEAHRLTDKNPIIYELGPRVKLKTVTTTSLTAD